MSHDAATGYLNYSKTDPVINEVIDWAKTQPAGFAEQLECGSRGFDLRPKLINGELYMHHGGVDVFEKMEAAVQDALAWCHANPDELVIMFVTDCVGTGCTAAAQKVFQALGVKYLTSSECGRIGSSTVSAVKNMSQLAGGGSLLAIEGCMSENYVPSIECYGQIGLTRQPYHAKDLDSTTYYWCYDPKTKHIPFDQLWSYMNSTTSALPSSDNLWMAQGHWQYSSKSIEAGLIHLSSILKDSSNSNINGLIADRLQAGAWKYLNVLELGDVCNGGPAIAKLLQQRAQQTADAISVQR